jgi:hypothetical protein
MVLWIEVQLTWEVVMFVCLKPVAGVIVAPRWASLTTWLSQIPQIRQFNS